MLLLQRNDTPPPPVLSTLVWNLVGFFVKICVASACAVWDLWLCYGINVRKIGAGAPIGFLWTSSSQSDVHLLLDQLDVPVADLVGFGGAACDDLLDEGAVGFVLGPPLPHRIQKVVEALVHQLLACDAAHGGRAAHGGDVLGLAGVEGLMVLEERAVVRIARRLHCDPVGVRDGVAHLVPDFIGRVGQVDGVAKALAHLGVSVQTSQAGRRRELRLGHCDLCAIEFVEVAHQAACELHVGDLVLTYRYEVGVAECDVCALAHRVAEEAVGQLREVVAEVSIALAHAVASGLGLDRRVDQKVVDRREHGVEDRQLGDRRDHRLLDEGHLLGVESGGDVVHAYVVDGVVDHLGVREVGRQGLDVGDEDELLIAVLELDAALEGAHVVSDVELACGPVSGEYPFHIPLSPCGGSLRSHPSCCRCNSSRSHGR